jgi:hypothetical protein
MKKRFMALLLVLVLIVSMSGCGSNTADSDIKDATKTNDNADSSTSEDAESASDESTSDASTSDESSSVENEEPVIEEQVLLDQDGIKITATSLEEDIVFGPEVKLTIENTTDKNITVQTLDTSINGIMIVPTLSCDVAVGKQANDAMIFYSTDLERAGIDKIASIEFKFTIFETETYDTIFDTDTITLNTSIKDTYVQSYDDSGEVIFDSNDIKVVAQGLDTSSEFLGPEIKFYIENNSKSSVYIQTQNFSVNGIMVDSAFYGEISSGKKSFSGMTFYDLADKGIEEILNVEFSLNISDPITFETIVDSDIIALSFE